jgi:hypothetical protein
MKFSTLANLSKSLIVASIGLVLPSISIAQQSCSFIIHVNGATGADSPQCGTEESPCSKINVGIQRAITEGYSDVRVAASGTYNEVINLADGVSLWGGFDGQWAVTGLTTIAGGTSGPEFFTMKGENINSSTVISDFEIIAPDAITVGKSSYGVHVKNSIGLVFQRTTIRGGMGSSGTIGSAGTNADITGINGTPGASADEFNTACNDNSSGAGGVGATLSNPNTRGGNGGRGGYMDSDCGGFPDLDATDGIGGESATISGPGYGQPGGGSGTCAVGIDGTDGQTVHGIGGAGASTAASLSGDYWVATNGINGTLGVDGTGGGGGGGSGGCDSGTDSYGAGGGGGGSGGTAAPLAGTAGLSGGNSAAVFLLSSTCSFIDCSFILGVGGNGGNGGVSGVGTAGGIGGPGGSSVGDSQKGGDGGDGGAGGNSGGGGGGAAGSSYGIYGFNSTINQSGTTFTGGLAGAQGLGGSGIPTGVAGTDGSAGTVESVSGSVTDNVSELAAEPDPCIEILTLDVELTTLCGSQTTLVDFSAVGSFSGANTFTAQLSDANGDFSNPTDIGSVVSATSGTISVLIPLQTASGTGYRIRVVSSATPAIGNSNGIDLVINALPEVTANASLTTICLGDDVVLSGGGADTYIWDNNIVDGATVSPTETTIYTVSGLNTTTACSNTASVEVTVLEAVDASVEQAGNQLAAVLAGATYQWVDCDNANAPIENATEQTYLAPVSGNYAVVVTQNACSEISSCFNTTVVGAETEAENYVVLLYPNPSTGVVQFISNVNNPSEVSVVNMMGQVVFTKGNVTNNATIALDQLTNGVYLVRFSNQEVNVVRQLILQK